MIFARSWVSRDGWMYSLKEKKRNGFFGEDIMETRKIDWLIDWLIVDFTRFYGHNFLAIAVRGVKIWERVKEKKKYIL